MESWKVRLGEEELSVDGVAELQEWARTGRISATDYVYNPVLGRWMYATEAAEIADLVGLPRKQQEAANLNRASLGLGCLGLLLLVAFPPAGIVVLVFAVALSAYYHVQRSALRKNAPSQPTPPKPPSRSR